MTNGVNYLEQWLNLSSCNKYATYRFGGSSHTAKVVSDSKNRPVVADSTEIGVFSVFKDTLANELSADHDILASLKGRRYSVR